MAISFAFMKERIARKLGVLSVGSSLSAEDATLIAEKCAALQAQLEVFDIVNIDFGDGIDESYADIVCDMAAALLVDDFMIAEPKRSKLAAEGILGLPVTSVAERRLRKIVAPLRVSRPVKAEYF